MREGKKVASWASYGSARSGKTLAHRGGQWDCGGGVVWNRGAEEEDWREREREHAERLAV